MDIDISDILADVSKPAPPLQHTSAHRQHQTTLDPATAYADHQLLVQAWTSERCSPELLPYPTSLMSRIMVRVRTQISRIEDLAAGISDPSSSSSSYANGYGTSHRAGGGGGYASGGSNQNTNLILSILQTDLSRTQFLVRSLLRQRLAKITKFAVYYLALLQAADPDQKTPSLLSSSGSGAGGGGGARGGVVDVPSGLGTRDVQAWKDIERGNVHYLLSDSERQFLVSHQSLLTGFYEGSFLGALPVQLRRLDDSSGGVNMVEGPGGGDGGSEGGKGAVVVRCLVEVWANEEEIEEERRIEREAGGKRKEIGGGVPMAEVDLRMSRGQVWVVRWADVRRGVLRGELQLL